MKARIIKATGSWYQAVTSEGHPASSVIVLTRISNDAILWHAIERIRGGDKLPDLPSIKLTRVK